jgi:hypothetical protein
MLGDPEGGPSLCIFLLLQRRLVPSLDHLFKPPKHVVDLHRTSSDSHLNIISKAGGLFSLPASKCLVA